MLLLLFRLSVLLVPMEVWQAGVGWHIPQMGLLTLYARWPLLGPNTT
jgi:hypothetical protein